MKNKIKLSKSRLLSLILVIVTVFTTFSFNTITTYAEEYYIGDVNNDKKINTLDALLILKQSAELLELSQTAKMAGDVNNDKKTNTLDALTVLKLSANVITSLNNDQIYLPKKIVELKKNKSENINLIIPLNSIVTYSSDNEQIAKVTSDGTIFAIENGVVKINITCKISLNDGTFQEIKNNIEVIIEDETEKIFNGIDVSVWQGKIDWNKVKLSNIDFAILRAGFGWKTADEENYFSQRDNEFLNNYEGAKANNIPVGVYHYAYARTPQEAVLEAEYLMSIIKDKTFEYPIFYDMEDDSITDLSKKQLTEIALAFLTTLEKNGYNAGVYANYYWVTTKLDMSLLQDYDLWIAKYSDSLGYEGSSIWQYTSSGAVDGINGRVDLNYGYIDYLALNKGLKLNNNK